MAVRTINTTTSDTALARHMSQTFNYMAGGVGVSALVAYLTLQSQALLQFAATGGGLMMMIVWLAFGFFGHKIIFSVSAPVGLAIFAAFSAFTGFALAPLLYVSGGMNVTMAFLTAAIMFAGASLYGYTSNKSLSGWGNFLMLGMWGLLGVSLVAIVWSFFGTPPSALTLAISIVAVPLFAAVTAWETNTIKETFYTYAGDEQIRSRLAILSASSLYMNFTAMFIHILNILNTLRGNN